MAAMDVTKLLVANIEFGQWLDGIFNELFAKGSIPADIGTKVAGMATAWSAISNSTIQDIAVQIAVKDTQMAEHKEEIKKIYEKMEKTKEAREKDDDVCKRVNEKEE